MCRLLPPSGRHWMSGTAYSRSCRTRRVVIRGVPVNSAAADYEKEGKVLLGKDDQISCQRAYKLFVQRTNSQSQKMNVQERANRILVTRKAKNIVSKIMDYNHNVI